MRLLAVRTIIIMCAVVIFIGAPSFADEQQAKDSPELAEAKKKQALAEAEKATAEAQRDTFKAKLGDLSTDKIEKSTLTTDKLAIEGKLLAYKSAMAIANTIGGSVSEKIPSKKLVIATQLLNDLILYQTFMTQTELLLNSITPLTTKPKLQTDPLPSVCSEKVEKSRFVPPLDVASIAIQLISLLKVDTTVKGIEATIDEFGFAAALSAELSLKGIDVVYPSRFYAGALAPPQDLQIVTRVNELSRSKIKLDHFLDWLIGRQNELKASAAKASNACKALYARDVETLENLGRVVKDAATTTQGILDQVMKTENQSGIKLLQQLSFAEILRRNYQDAAILELKTLEAGGAAKTKEAFWGTSLRFSGGAVIAYMLFEGKTGRILTSGLVPHYSGYIEDSEIDKKLRQ
jgi:hypothetical protein